MALNKKVSRKTEVVAEVEETPVAPAVEEVVEAEEVKSEVEKAEEMIKNSEVLMTAGITFDAEEPKKPPVEVTKRVKIATVKDHSCVIGGTHYHFEKDKVVSVPEHVKNILKKAGLLAPV